ncbi:MAG: Holliday junction resolvase RuvX [Parcubacteria group bacterium]|jgi:putative Holliday junction resolvase
MDFGKAKVGLAVADSETRIAFSFGTLKNGKNLMRDLANIIEKKGIEKIIIGNAGAETQDFAAALKKRLNVPIEFQNEMFSTQQAERNLIEKGAKKIKRFDDQEAARIILQSWLDKKG